MDKMTLGMEAGVDPGHIVLDGYPAPPPQKKNGLEMDQWTKV